MGEAAGREAGAGWAEVDSPGEDWEAEAARGGAGKAEDSAEDSAEGSAEGSVEGSAARGSCENTVVMGVP